MNNRDKGKNLEIYVAEELQKIFAEIPSIRPTKASSGGSHNSEIADINSQNVFVECKNNQINWFKKKVWTKLLNSLPFGTTKVPLYIIKDEIEGVLICLSFQDFCNLLKEKK